jgi:two-component system response regulator HydG
MVATILVIDDKESVREGTAKVCERMGHKVLQANSGRAGLGLLAGAPVDLVLTDLKMEGLDGIGVLKAVKEQYPSMEVVLMTGFGTIETAVEAIKLGAFDFITKPFSPDVLRPKVDGALERRRLREENERLAATNEVLSGARDRDKSGPALPGFQGMIGESATMRALYEKLEKIGRSETNVHVDGESGTGKELVAQAIHNLSRRAGGPLIKVNCGALPETLLESELFGHEKGAFTNAVKKKLGRFELAHGGTIFLDEIGEIAPAVQVKLLRVLQEREFERVGGEQPVKVDVRVISATNRDLTKEVAAGRFREDLFYRLHIVPVHLPALRERTDDIVPLARHFVEKLRRRTNPEIESLTREAESALQCYHYPGNVRELENIVEQALVFATPPSIGLADLPPQVSGAKPKPNSLQRPPENIGLDEALESLERQMILEAYEATGGVKTKTADRLKIKTSALYYKLEKFGIGTVAGRQLETGGAAPADESPAGSTAPPSSDKG